VLKVTLPFVNESVQDFCLLYEIFPVRVVIYNFKPSAQHFHLHFVIVQFN